MTIPTITGVHHLKFPVADFDANIAWFEKVFGAQRVPRFDHHDSSGALFAVILTLPGFPVPLELRHAPRVAQALVGYDPVTFGVADRAALDNWATHLDAVDVAHTPVISAFIGDMLHFATPEGVSIRLYTDPVNGFDNVELSPQRANVDYAHLAPTLM